MHADDYLQRISHAVALIERALAAGGELPDLAALAAAAHFSPFHFHRVYRALAGEPIGRTVARLRQLRALHMLQERRRPITDIALTVGYETPQAFARAFRQSLGATPSELRAAPGRLAHEITLRAVPPMRTGAPPAPLRVEVVSVDPLRVIALHNTGDYADLDQAYDRLFGWAAERGAIDSIRSLYGIPWHDPRDDAADICEFDCALGFDRLPDDDPDRGFVALGIDGGRYARTRHVGAFAMLYATLDRVLAEWLPTSGAELRDAPIWFHYQDDPAQTPEAALRTDIYLPLR
jgi:AraC family transcriptional regulator